MKVCLQIGEKTSEFRRRKIMCQVKWHIPIISDGCQQLLVAMRYWDTWHVGLQHWHLAVLLLSRRIRRVENLNRPGKESGSLGFFNMGSSSRPKLVRFGLDLGSYMMGSKLIWVKFRARSVLTGTIHFGFKNKFNKCFRGGIKSLCNFKLDKKGPI